MTHVVVDPVTRIEGHLRIEAEVDGGAVKEAWSSCTMFRGIELILEGRDPRDAWAFAQRICGVCTTVHAIASIRAVEHAIGASPPPNARILRNLIIAAQNVQDHVIHFYHLQALDWVDIVSALSADPAKTSSLAQSISDWPFSSAKYYTEVRERVKAFVERGQLGIFANAYWGHSAYRLPPEANLMAVAHYLEALDWQRRFIKIHAILGGKNPHLQSFLVGGMATPVDPDAQASLNMGTIAALRKLVAEGVDFVTRVYVPDVLAIASFYKDWFSIGAGVTNFMSYGDFPLDDDADPQLYIPAGIIHSEDLSRIDQVDQAKIDEYITHSWYDYSVGNDKGLNPYQGETHPHYTGPKPPYQRLNDRGEVFLAQVAALRRGADAGRTLGTHAGCLCNGASGAREGADRQGTQAAQRAALGAVLYTRAHRSARNRGAGAGRIDGHVGRGARRQHGAARLSDPGHFQMGSEHLAAGVLRRRLSRGAARLPRPLGTHQGRQDRQVPVRGSEHLERRTPRCQGPARSL